MKLKVVSGYERNRLQGGAQATASLETERVGQWKRAAEETLIYVLGEVGGQREIVQI